MAFNDSQDHAEREKAGGPKVSQDTRHDVEKKGRKPKLKKVKGSKVVKAKATPVGKRRSARLNVN